MCLLQSFQCVSPLRIANAQDRQLQKLYEPHRHTESSSAFPTTSTTSCVLPIALRLQTPFDWIRQESRFDWRFLSELQALYATNMPNQKTSGMTLRNKNTAQHIEPRIRAEANLSNAVSHDSFHQGQQPMAPRLPPLLQPRRSTVVLDLRGSSHSPG
jgi:hypothetical protein